MTEFCFSLWRNKAPLHVSVMLYISASVYRALGCSTIGHSGRASLNSDVQVCLKCAGPGCLWSSTFMLSSVLKEHIDSSSQVCFTFPDSFQKRTPLPIDFLPFLYFLFSTFIFYFFKLSKVILSPFILEPKRLCLSIKFYKGIFLNAWFPGRKIQQEWKITFQSSWDHGTLRVSWRCHQVTGELSVTSAGAWCLVRAKNQPAALRHRDDQALQFPQSSCHSNQNSKMLTSVWRWQSPGSLITVLILPGA